MSKRALILGGVGIAGIAVAGFFLLAPDPQAVLRKAQKKLVVEDSMRLDVEGTLVLPPEDLAPGVIAGSATSVDIVMQTDVSFAIPLDPATRTTFTITQGKDAAAVKLAGEARRMGGRHYLKLDETGALTRDMADRVKGKWIASDRPFLDFILPPDERTLTEKPLDLKGLIDFAYATAKVDLFRVTQKLPDMKIGDVASRHYAVELNMDAVSALMLKMREIRTGAPVTSEDVLAVTADVVRWGQPLGEVWVGKRDGKFRKIELASALAGDVTTGAVGGAVTFSRYGEPVAVEAPEAEDIEKVLGPIFTKRLSLSDGRETSSGTQGTGSTEPAALPGAAVQDGDSDGDGLSDGQEHFYGSDAWNPDTDADGWKDGLEIEKGMNPIGPGSLFGFGL